MWEGPGREAVLADEGAGHVRGGAGAVRGRDLDGQLEGDVHLSLLSQCDDFRKLYNLRERERERDIERDIERDMERERERERQRDRERGRERQRETKRERERGRERRTDRERERKRKREPDKIGRASCRERVSSPV